MAKKKIGIIGGGISGAGLAYHLSLYEGEADVTVFEKDTIGGASTAKSAGTVCLLMIPSRTDTGTLDFMVSSPTEMEERRERFSRI